MSHGLFSLPPLRSGGLMLGYHCSQRCRHCLYRCGPDAAPGEWMTEAVLDASIDFLSRECWLTDIHLAGGEATLNPGLLRTAVRKIREKGVRLSYLETNGAFATSPEAARDMLMPLKEAGLGALLLSISPYHNESVPLARTLTCLEAASEVFGGENVFPWLGHFIPMLSRLDPDVPHSLRDTLEANGIAWGDPALLRLFPLTPGGRVPEGLADFFPRRPAEEFRGGHCRDILATVDHFHIDPYGNLFTGHCPGIIVANAADPDAARGERPILSALVAGGPWALMELAADACGFAPDPAGYVSPCHLCFEARKALCTHNASAWPELGPAVYYRT